MELDYKVALRKVVYLIPVALFTVFVLYFSWNSYEGRISRKVFDTKMQTQSLKDLTDGFERTLRENFYRKYDFINMAGAMAIGAGFNQFNHIQKLRNGFLTNMVDSNGDIETVVENLKVMDGFLKAHCIEFLFVAIPNKNSVYDAEFARGYGDQSHETLSRLMEKTKEAGIPVLDMDSEFQKGKWRTEDIFFRTDHHWLPTAALKAAQEAMRFLEGNNWAVYDEDKLDLDNYRADKYGKWFLGSQGRRTGKFFGGVDDITIYYPKFDVDASYSALSSTGNWSFGRGLIDANQIKPRDYFRKDPHSAYLRQQRKHQIIRNSKAANDKRLLILGDSYSRAFTYFLSTQFKEIHNLEPRIHSDGTLAQLIAEVRPDIVVLLNEYEQFFNPKFTDIGLVRFNMDKTTADSNGVPLWKGDLAVSAPKNASGKFEPLKVQLLPGQTYTMTVDSTRLEGNGGGFIQLTLQNLTTNKPVANRYLDGNSDQKQQWFFTVPNLPNDTFAIYLYAGTKGHTQGASAMIEGATVLEGIHEDPPFCSIGTTFR